MTSEQLCVYGAGEHWVLNEIGVSGSELEGGVRREYLRGPEGGGMSGGVGGRRHIWEGQREETYLVGYKGGGMSGRARMRRHASAGFSLTWMLPPHHIFAAVPAALSVWPLTLRKIKERG